jgi:hypothetical protein
MGDNASKAKADDAPKADNDHAAGFATAAPPLAQSGGIQTATFAMG